jgi:hypothetical protein
MTELKTITQKLSIIQKNLSVKKNQKNEFSNYSYRTAEDIYSAFKKIINTYDDLDVVLITTFKHVNISDKVFLECEAIFKDENQEIKANAFAELASGKKGMDLAQLTGATQTYARKYALQSLLAIDDKEMDLDSQEIKEKEEKALTKEKENLIDQINELINEDLIGADEKIITKEKILQAKKVSNFNEIGINNLKHIIKTLADYKVKQQHNQENENI